MRISDWSSDVCSSDLLAAIIEELLSILADRVKLYGVMREELVAVRDEFATPRRTLVAPAADGIDDEDLIEREEMVITVTLDGYIKRTPLEIGRASCRERVCKYV